VYRRRYEIRRSSKPKLHFKTIWRKTIFNMADGILIPCNVAGGFGMTCHWIRPNVRHIGILHLVSISTISPQSTCQWCHTAPIDYPRPEKMMLCRLSRWRISAIFDFRGPIMGSLKSSCTTSYRSSIETIALNLLSFWENSVFFI